MKAETTLDRLRRGSIPYAVEKAAATEGVSSERLAAQMLDGSAVIPAGRAGRQLRLAAIGAGLRTKVNANLGTSSEMVSAHEEAAKLEMAEKAGADAVMDLSCGGDTIALRRLLLSRTNLPFGTVPVYEAAVEARESFGSIVKMGVGDLMDVVERQAIDGVDFMTIHAALTRSALKKLNAQGRVMDVVSRGGAFMIAWMLHNDRENPFYEHYDSLLEILARHDVTISLGDGLRPGCLADASDRAQIAELVTMGELASRAREAGVQAMIEGPGHVPLQDIESNVILAKKLTGGAPFYVLGPLVTDVAPGYDHITAAIGGALAGAAGADFICYVTPAEHLGLPGLEDVRQGVIAARIAAHAADIAKGSVEAAAWDRQMAEARKSLDWESQINLSMDPDKARSVYEARQSGKVEGCSMCGELCAMKLVSEHLGLEAGDIKSC
ncbi:MAG: phosphomethylpyrimidine synthase ThiC [Thermoleophilia bacterium]|nr:phosphomethylpyrimidine synthase ThiC [Thermoleophilia bacterium]